MAVDEKADKRQGGQYDGGGFGDGSVKAQVIEAISESITEEVNMDTVDPRCGDRHRKSRDIRDSLAVDLCSTQVIGTDLERIQVAPCVAKSEGDKIRGGGH